MKGLFFNLLRLVFVFILVSACGASKESNNSGSSDNSSRDTTDDTDDTDDDSNSKVNYYSNCNSFSDLNLNGVVTTYLNPFTNLYEWEYIRMEIKEIPSEIENSDNFYLQIFRWSEDTPNSPYINKTPVGIYFQHEDGRWLNSTLIDSISKENIEKIISDNALTDTTLKNFFSKVTLILAGMDLKYDAIMINSYDSSVGTDALTSTDILLPAFAADPNIYAETHSPNLVKIHPNYDTRKNGYSEWQYYQETLGLCN
jgi:hypothetical protein